MNEKPTFEQVSEITKRVTLGLPSPLFEEFPETHAAVVAQVDEIVKSGQFVSGFTD